MLKGERREVRLKAVSGIMLTLLLIGMLTLAFNIQPVRSELIPFSDEFNTTTLDSRWTTVDPARGATFDLSVNPGWLRITTVNINAPCILQNVSGDVSNDFTIETKVMATMNESGEGAGIIVRKYDPHYDYSLVLQRLYRQSEHQIGFGIPSNGLNYVTLASDLNPTYLKLERKSGLFTLYYSSDGITWNTLAWIGALVVPELEIGLQVINGYNGPFFADFDYFKVSNPIIVPDDYPNIQEAINHANEGDTIFVRNGTYYENVVVNKSISLIGENRSTTIIDGNGTGTVITISASNVMVSQFTIQNSALTAHGVGIFFSNHNMLINNTIRDNYEGIYLYETSNNTLRNNNMTGNKYNFGVRGASLLHFIHDIDTSNTINEKLVYYLVNQRNIVVNSSTFPDAGYLGLVNSTNIAVKDLNLTNNHQGVLFVYTTNSTLINVNASNNRYGFYLVHCDNDSINGNVINSNYWDGIYLRSCSNVTITENSLTNNVVGIRLEYFGDNIISGNNLQNNAYTGIFVALSNSNIVGENVIAMSFPFEDYGHGIWLDRSSNNIVKSNTITSNKWQAIILQESASNEIFSNTVTLNGLGIYLDSSTGNLIYHNNFVDNTVQVNSTNSANIWDDGYPSGGNYWSDHVCVGNPSDGSQPYIIDENNIDHYPFQDPNGWIAVPERIVGVSEGSWFEYLSNWAWTSNDPNAEPPSYWVEVNNTEWLRISVQSISGTNITSQGLTHFKNGSEWTDTYVVDVDTGQGNGTGTFIAANVSIGDLIYTSPPPGLFEGATLNETMLAIYLGETVEVNHLNLTQTWTYLGFEYAWSVNYYWYRDAGALCEFGFNWYNKTGEYVTTFSYAYVIVDKGVFTISGDINSDGIVNINDVVIAALAFGSYPGHPRWNPRADIRQDGIINIIDLVIIGVNFGKRLPL